jgi:hypothetical protein
MRSSAISTIPSDPPALRVPGVLMDGQDPARFPRGLCRERSTQLVPHSAATREAQVHVFCSLKVGVASTPGTCNQHKLTQIKI